MFFADFGVNFGYILPPFWHRFFDGILEAVGGRLEGGNGDPRNKMTGGLYELASVFGPWGEDIQEGGSQETVTCYKVAGKLISRSLVAPRGAGG